MGVRAYNEGRHYSPKVSTFKGCLGGWQGQPSGVLSGRRSSTPRMTLLYDGTAGTEGLPPDMPPTDIWVDPSCLLELGATQMTLTASYRGEGTCEVYGAMLPPNYAVDVYDPVNGSDLVNEMGNVGQLLYTVAPFVAVNLLQDGTTGNAIVFTLYRFKFSGGAGSLTLSAM